MAANRIEFEVSFSGHSSGLERSEVIERIKTALDQVSKTDKGKGDVLEGLFFEICDVNIKESTK